MRIAVVAPPWIPVPPPSYGGTELMIGYLAEGLARAGHEVLLVAHPDSATSVPVWSPIEDLGDAHMGDLVTEAQWAVRTGDALSSFDVIHDHTLLGSLLADRHSAPVVATHHGPFNAALDDVFRAVAMHASVIAISRTQADGASTCPISRVIHHGLDVSDYPFGAGDGGYLACLGRMSRDKGVHVAARVASDLGVPLKIAAKMREPGEYEYFERQVKPLLTGDVEYVGELGHDDKRALLAGAKALVNPIAWPEPFGLAMIEALACGTPVVSFATGAATEIIVDGVTGFLCDDEPAMKRAVNRVASIERAACRQHIVDNFSADKMVAAHIDLYQWAIERWTVGHGHRQSAASRPLSASPDRAHRRSITMPDGSPLSSTV